MARLLATLIFLAAGVGLLGLVTKRNPAPLLISLGHSTARAISRGRWSPRTGWAFLLGLAVWAVILFVAINVVSYALTGGSVSELANPR